MASRHRLLVPVLVAASVAWAVGVAPVQAASDPGLPQQWGLHTIGAPTAWGAGTGAGITVAVIDSGVDLDHPDLQAKLQLVSHSDWVDGDGSPDDEEGHGTHVAGIAAAVTDNGKGVAGTAPSARILPLRVLDADGEGTSSDVVAAIEKAVAAGAQVVNLSLGELSPVRFVLGSSIADAVNAAWSKGVICVVAAGNEFLFPSGYDEVNGIVVTASTKSDGKSDFSNSVGSARWGMAAPGGGDTLDDVTDDILSTYKDGQYAYLRGTSMAAPFVAGAAAVLRGLGLTPQQTVDRLRDTAKDIGSPGDDSVFGDGRLDLAAATASFQPSGGGATPTTVTGSAGGGATPTSAPAVAPTSTTTPRTSPAARPRATVPPTTEGDDSGDDGLSEEPFVTDLAEGARGGSSGDGDGDDAPDPLAVLLGLVGVGAAGGGVAWLRARRRPTPG